MHLLQQPLFCLPVSVASPAARAERAKEEVDALLHCDLVGVTCLRTVQYRHLWWIFQCESCLLHFQWTPNSSSVTTSCTVVLSHQFFGHLQPDIMLNYSHNDVLVTTARVALFLHLVLNYPVLLHPTRSSLNLLLALLYNSMKGCLTRRRGSRDETEPLLPKSPQAELKVWGNGCLPGLSPVLLLPLFPPLLIDSPSDVVL